jgi:hypothetical protein
VTAASTARSPRSLRAGLRRLATGLIVYGVIGLILALVAAVSLIYASGRLSAVGGRVEQQLATVVETLDRTAAVLADASATATSFAVTLERTPPVVRQTADTVAQIRADLRSAQAQMDEVQILGRQPLSGVAGAFGEMASNLDGLDARLELIAGDLEGNRTALLANAASLGALGEQLGTIAERLQTGTVGESLDDLRVAVMIVMVVLLIWIIVPAAGALWLGAWLRGTVGVEDDD